MTTIAQRNGIVAHDSQGTVYNIAVSKNMRKSFIIPADGFEIENDGDGGDLSRSEQRQIRNLGGWLFVGAGHAVEVQNLARWLRKRDGKFAADEPESYEDSPSFINSSAMLIPPQIDSPIILLEYDEVLVDNFEGEHFSIGSGSQVAIGAMDFGASAAEAIAIAADRDNYTCFPIISYEIKDGEWVRGEDINSIDEMPSFTDEEEEE